MGPSQPQKENEKVFQKPVPFSGAFTCCIVSGDGYFFCWWTFLGELKQLAGCRCQPAVGQASSPPSSRPWIQLTSVWCLWKKTLWRILKKKLGCQDAACWIKLGTFWFVYVLCFKNSFVKDEHFSGGWGKSGGPSGVAPARESLWGQITFGVGPFLTFQFLFLAFFRQEKNTSQDRTHFS